MLLRRPAEFALVLAAFVALCLATTVDGAPAVPKEAPHPGEYAPPEWWCNMGQQYYCTQCVRYDDGSSCRGAGSSYWIYLCFPNGPASCTLGAIIICTGDKYDTTCGELGNRQGQCTYQYNSC